MSILRVSSHDAQSLPVVVVGGGVAALEAVLSLRADAGDDLPIELVCPDEHFTYRPLSVLEPFSAVGRHVVPLERFAREHDIVLRRARLTAVHPDEHIIETDDGPIGYRALLIATGAQAAPAMVGARRFGGREDVVALDSALEHIEWEFAGTLAFVVPDGGAWALPLYELALLARTRLDTRGRPDAEVVVLTAEDNPLELLGDDASDTLQMLILRSGVRLITRVEVQSFSNRVLVLDDGQTITADHVFALPRWRGTAIPGVPVDDEGFVRVDEHCRVVGVPDVYAAGDVTAGFPKQGGLAAAQADAASSALLADLGYPVEAEPFEPSLAGVLLTGDVLETLPDRAAAGAPAWTPPTKIVARYLSAYLRTREPLSRNAESWQRERRIPGEIELSRPASRRPEG